MIRTAKLEDLERILELGEEFGHLMSYHKTVEGLIPHLPYILVNELPDGSLDGYYNYQPVRTREDVDLVSSLKCIPKFLLEGGLYRVWALRNRKFAVLMQGASHREVFRSFVECLQEGYDELWCWCSIKSRRPESYESLGFSFSPDVRSTFFNPHVGRESTYRLGRWTRGGDRDNSETRKTGSQGL